jgi:hypothetical protein
MRHVMRWLIGGVVVGAVWCAGIGIAAAETAEAPDTVGAAFTVSSTLVTILLGIVAPIVTGVLVRPTNPSWVKVLVAGMVGTVLESIHQLVRDDGSVILSGEWALGVALILAAQFGSYFGVWKPVSGGELNAKLGPGVIPGGGRAE